jgi:D-lactate dehydrogenase
MIVSVFDSHTFDRVALESANGGKHDLRFLTTRLTLATAELAKGSKAVCCFVNDCLDESVLRRLQELGVELIALRSAGYNHIDLNAAKKLGLRVVRVPEYSPYAVAEHAAALLLDFNRKISRAHNRVRDMNFSLDGLVGFDLHGKSVGVIGTGKIGRVFAQIMRGFGCHVICYDIQPDERWAKENNVQYSDLHTLFKTSDIISLHIPLNEKTKHIIDEKSIALMKAHVILINTGRGGLIHTQALIQSLKQKRIGGACLDVYEEEEGVFFCDLSESGLADDTLARLLTFPNVSITAHQAFLTQEALKNIAETTLGSITTFENGGPLLPAVTLS